MTLECIVNIIKKSDDLKSIVKTLLTEYEKEDINVVLSTLYKTTVDDILNENISTSLIINRTGQNELRKQIIIRDKKCVLSGANHECCEVAHIKSFSNCTPYEKYDIQNAILLRADLHKLFDKYLWSINPKTSKVEISSKINKESSEYYPINNHKNKKVNLSKKQLKFIIMHYKIFVASHGKCE